jgi:hypothetical protein
MSLWWLPLLRCTPQGMPARPRQRTAIEGGASTLLRGVLPSLGAGVLGEHGAAAVLRARGGAPPAVGARATRWKGSLNRLSHPRIFRAGLAEELAGGFRPSVCLARARDAAGHRRAGQRAPRQPHTCPSKAWSARTAPRRAGGSLPDPRSRDGLRRVQRRRTEKWKKEEERPARPA